MRAHACGKFTCVYVSVWRLEVDLRMCFSITLHISFFEAGSFTEPAPLPFWLGCQACEPVGSTHLYTQLPVLCTVTPGFSMASQDLNSGPSGCPLSPICDPLYIFFPNRFLVQIQIHPFEGSTKASNSLLPDPVGMCRAVRT